MYVTSTECPYQIGERVKATFTADVSYPNVTRKAGTSFVGWVAERYSDGIMVENGEDGISISFDRADIER